jgi:penicillin amidase
MRILSFAVMVVLTSAFFWFLSVRVGRLPPLGKVLNPVSGFWKNEEPARIGGSEIRTLTGLKQSVSIQYDSSWVPHIFASSDYDLYFTQGYVTAQDRLWQMDLQVRKASGRLSELFGEETYQSDRYFRRIGLVQAAERSLRLMMEDPATATAIQGYSDGVNAYIKTLDASSLPVEFKLLDYRPEAWKPVNSALMIKLMAETLSGGAEDFGMTNDRRALGEEAVEELFPNRAFQDEPVVPAGTAFPQATLSAPLPPQKDINGRRDEISAPRQEGIGSNNWAVNSGRSRSATPMLANDPHLTLSFPSIWYQLQLQAPGINVYGVSIPGTPGIIVGFNQNVSWGVTNAEADTRDWYQVKFRDSTHAEYWYDGNWIPARRREEVIEVKGKPELRETIIVTHYGPVVYWQDSRAGTPGNLVGYAMRWVASEASRELLTFYLLNRSKTYADCQAALRHYTAPAQNFLFATVANDIGITTAGHFPLRYQGQGKYVLDGSSSGQEWGEPIPFDLLPSAHNPHRGFLSSANQNIVDSSYPYYLSWRYGGFERGRRINQRLAGMMQADVDSFRLLQMDNYSTFADLVLDSMIVRLNGAPTQTQPAAINILRSWNRRFDAQESGATLFNAWWVHFYKLVWEDEFESAGRDGRLPSRDQTARLLLTQPGSPWFDNTATPVRENEGALLATALTQASDSLIRRFGSLEAAAWGKSRRLRIEHLGQIPGFGSADFVSGGSATTVNAQGSGFGPSWRMVVELGARPKGFGILPGGQSGNPGSPFYDDQLSSWEAGRLRPLLFFANPADFPASTIKTLTLK